MIEILPNWHPIFVHFTVALFTTSLLVFIFSFFATTDLLKEHAQVVARWNFWIAVIATFATVIAGWFAYNSVAHDTPSHLAMTEHKNWALITSGILLVVAVSAWWLNHNIKIFGIGLLVVVSFLWITAWHGGELVYRYGLGVMSMPMAGGEGHDHAGHDHGNGDASIQQHHDSIVQPAAEQHHSEQDGHAHEMPGEEKPTGNNVHIHNDGKAHEH